MAAVSPAGPPPTTRQSRTGSSIRSPMDCRTAGSRLARADELDVRSDRLRACRLHGVGAGIPAGDDPARMEPATAEADCGRDPAGDHGGYDPARNPLRGDIPARPERADGGLGD